MKENQLETLEKVLSCIRYFERRRVYLGETLMCAKKLGIKSYIDSTSKELKDAYRALDRLEKRYNRLLNGLERF